MNYLNSRLRSIRPIAVPAHIQMLKFLKGVIHNESKSNDFKKKALKQSFFKFYKHNVKKENRYITEIIACYKKLNIIIQKKDKYHIEKDSLSFLDVNDNISTKRFKVFCIKELLKKYYQHIPPFRRVVIYYTSSPLEEIERLNEKSFKETISVSIPTSRKLFDYLSYTNIINNSTINRNMLNELKDTKYYIENFLMDLWNIYCKLEKKHRLGFGNIIDIKEDFFDEFSSMNNSSFDFENYLAVTSRLFPEMVSLHQSSDIISDLRNHNKLLVDGKPTYYLIVKKPFILSKQIKIDDIYQKQLEDFL